MGKRLEIKKCFWTKKTNIAIAFQKYLQLKMLVYFFLLKQKLMLHYLLKKNSSNFGTKCTIPRKKEASKGKANMNNLEGQLRKPDL